MRRQLAGFTLIELLVTLTITGLLLVLAIPSYVRWMSDAQTLNAAETVAEGLRTAYKEAITRSARVEFTIDPTTKTGGWTIQQPGGALIKEDRFATGADQTVFTPFPAASTTVTFNYLGMVEDQNAAMPTAPLQWVDISNPPAGGRDLRVLVPQSQVAGGKAGIRICDPAFVYSPTSPQGCP
jgi:type IV fimbrial biogenesis protein FimT